MQKKIIMYLFFLIFGSISVFSGTDIYLPSQIKTTERSHVEVLLWKRRHSQEYCKNHYKVRNRQLRDVLEPYKRYFGKIRNIYMNNPKIYIERLLVSNDILRIAISYSDLEALELLLKYGADVNGTEYLSKYEYDEKHFFSPLADAILHGDLKVVKFLIENGADVNGLVNGIKNFHTRINKEITKTDLLLSSRKGSPLYYALRCNRFEMIDLLLENNVMVSRTILNFLHHKIIHDQENKLKIYEKLVWKFKNYIDMQIEYEDFCNSFDKVRPCKGDEE